MTPADKLKPCPPSPNCVRSLLDEDEKHRVAPLSWSGDLAQAKSRLQQAVRAAGDATGEASRRRSSPAGRAGRGRRNVCPGNRNLLEGGI